MKNISGVELLFTVFIPLVLASCEKSGSKSIDPGDPKTIVTEIHQKEVIDSANSFAFDLFRPIIGDTKGEENIMISPFSITSALSMTLNGASGETFEDMKKTLRLDGKTLEQINDTYLKLMTEMVPVDERVVLEIANSVWVEKHLTVKEPFMTALATWYKAEAREISITDPQALDIVNDWIADKTHDRITDMLNFLEPDLAMLLINAVYFNGKWRYQFDSDKTVDEPFYLTPLSAKDVPMMHQKVNLNVAVTDNAKIVEIPYGQGNYTMVVVLPEEGFTTSGLGGSINGTVWNNWMAALEENTREVELSMPRFKYEYKRNLNDDLINLGMGVAFTGS
ncbi:MAG: serpin family protein, partial [Bacteroidales bacterium]